MSIERCLAAMVLIACFLNPARAAETLRVGVPGVLLIYGLLRWYACRLDARIRADLAELERLRQGRRTGAPDGGTQA